MHKMSKESKATITRLQSRLDEAEKILKTVLEDENTTSRQYLIALVTTYFSKIRGRETTNGQENKEI